MEEEEQSIDLGRYLNIVLHHWWVIVLVFVAFSAAAYTYTKATQTTVHRSSTIMLVQESRSGAVPGFGDLQTSRELARTYQQLVTTRPLLERVISELGLTEDVDSLRDQISVSLIAGTPLLEVEVTRNDPDSPIEIANTLTQIFIVDRQSTRLAEIARLEALANAQGTTNTAALVEAQLSTLGSLSVVEEARISTPTIRPSLRTNLVLAAFLGAFLGILLTFFLEYSSSKIKSVDQVDKLVNLSDLTPSLMGVVFKWSHKDVADNSVVVRDRPDSIYSEMFRQVRTGFQFAAVANPGKSYLVTSVGPQEGKSTVLSNLGTVLAQGGHRIIAVDTDLRRPTLHRYFGHDRRKGGVSTLMGNDSDPLSALHETDIPGLRLLLSGPIPPNPSDLLNSARMDEVIGELEADCDFLLLDSPPIMATADSMVLASKVDGLILVVNMGETHTETFCDALRMIQRAGSPVLGYLVNKVKTPRLGYGRYNYYRYYRRDEDEEPSGVVSNGAGPHENGRIPVVSKMREKIGSLLGRKQSRR